MLWPATPRTARWRTWVLVFKRIQALVVVTLTDRALDIQNATHPVPVSLRVLPGPTLVLSCVECTTAVLTALQPVQASI